MKRKIVARKTSNKRPIRLRKSFSSRRYDVNELIWNKTYEFKYGYEFALPSNQSPLSFSYAFLVCLSFKIGKILIKKLARQSVDTCFLQSVDFYFQIETYSKRVRRSTQSAFRVQVLEAKVMDSRTMAATGRQSTNSFQIGIWLYDVDTLDKVEEDEEDEKEEDEEEEEDERRRNEAYDPGGRYWKIGRANLR